MDSLEGFYCSDSLTYQPLAALGWKVDEISWRSNSVCWSDFDVVVIRSPWDYFDFPNEFISVLEQIDASDTKLANPLSVVRWNLDKRYLRDLAQRGIIVVPTLWRESLESEDFAKLFAELKTEEIVVKPTIGAGASDTFRISSDEPESRLVEVRDTFKQRPAMVQPFLQSIVERGEYSLFYFGGEFSHCISKVPAAGDFRVQEEHGGIITPCEADGAMLRAAQTILESIGEELLYARVDFVLLPSDELAVIEVELIEPSLYFGYDVQAASRFAAALDRMYRPR